MRDVISALYERAADSPDQTFLHLLVDGRRESVACAEALARSLRWAALYRTRAIQPRSPVVIILRHSAELYFAFLGAMIAGLTPSFMPFPSAKQDPELYWAQHKAVFDRIGVGCVVTWPANLAPLAEHCPGLPALTPEQLGADGAGIMGPKAAPGDIAFLQHSSGTTGLKKGVLLSYGAVAAQLERYAETLALAPSDVVVSWLPLYHDMGLIACFMLPLTLGLPIVSLDAFEWAARPQLLLEAVAEHGGTHVWLPNFAFHHLVRTAPADLAVDLSGVKAFIDCSEPCRLETFELFEQAFARLGVRRDQLRICYAMAETVFAVTQTAAAAPIGELSLGGRAVPSVGRPIRDVELSILDPDPQSGVGEVAVKAPFLFSGYHRDPQQTARKLVDGWYRTGDLGLVQGGELYLFGRADDLLILNGRNVMAHDLEFAVNAQVPEVKPGRCIALGVFDAEAGSQELVIVAEAAAGADARSLARAVRAAVFNEVGLMPKQVRLVEPGWLVKTTSGKLAREQNLRKHMSTGARLAEPAQ